jgi:hypothetical protein
LGEDGLPLSDEPPPDEEDDETTTETTGDSAATDDTSTSTSDASSTTETTSTSSSSEGGSASSSSSSGGGTESAGGTGAFAPKKKSSSKSYVDRKTGLVVKINTKPPMAEIQAKISEINMKGQVTVIFSDALNVPANFTNFNDRFLKIWVTSAEEVMPGQNKSIDSWQIVGFTST